MNEELGNRHQAQKRKVDLSTSDSEAMEKKKQGHGLGLLAQVSTLAWDLVVPIIGGVLLGSYLDRRLDSELTWTISLLVLGILIAFGNLYNLYREHGRGSLIGRPQNGPDRLSDEDKE